MHDVRVALDVHVALEPHRARARTRGRGRCGPGRPASRARPAPSRRPSARPRGRRPAAGVGAARAGARDRPQLAGAVHVEAHVRLRRASRSAGSRPCRAGTCTATGSPSAAPGRWQTARPAVRAADALGRHDLERVAGGDVLLRPLDGCDEARAGHLGGRGPRPATGAAGGAAAAPSSAAVTRSTSAAGRSPSSCGGRGRRRPTSTRAGTASPAGRRRRRFAAGSGTGSSCGHPVVAQEAHGAAERTAADPRPGPGRAAANAAASASESTAGRPAPRNE